MKTLMSILWMSLLSFQFGFGQSEAVGKWEGSLEVNGMKLRIVFNVTEAEGKLKATMDSPDQGAFDLPCDAATYAEGILKISMNAMGISYMGKPKGGEMEGTFEQNGMALDLNMKRKAKEEKKKEGTTEVSAGDKAKILGYWEGVLDINGVKLRIGFRVKEEAGELKTTMDSPDQGAYDLACNYSNFEDGVFKIKMDQIGMSYEGQPKGDRMEGVFKQNGTRLDLEMKREKGKTGGRAAKPQDPKEPFNYEVKEVVFENKSANLKLAGTLTMPKDCENCMAAILISGSGPQDRDESLLGHKPFWVIADYLSERGIAVLRFDDRGVGESTGDFSSATSADFKTDVQAAFEFLKGQKGIDATKIGLIGHSEGGLIAPMLAAENKEVAFIISLAGPGMAGKDLLPEQAKLIAVANGASEKEGQETYEITKKVCNLIAKEKDVEKLNAKIREIIEDENTSEKQVNEALQQYTSNWFRFFMAYDPVKAWKKVKCPVLALNGAKDLQVPADDNLKGIEKALKRNKKVNLMKFEGMNHLFQSCETGSPLEYAQIEETFSEKVLNVMADWLLSDVK
jgi:pimeloyl-ACP methyl ester carboxylesterase